MNKQRNAVYEKRNHALFGERLSLDIDNAFSIVAESLASSFKEQEDFEGFKLACIVNFGMDTSITQDDFKSLDAGKLADKLYTEAIQSYTNHVDSIGKKAIPVFKDIRASQGSHIENVVVPFTDGRKAINVLAPLDKTVETNGQALTSSMEKSITLAVIDEAWKDHLRSMDDLKQSVQTAYLEQKDPLVIYKVEAFQLFNNMTTNLNKDIIAFLTQANLPDQQQQNNQIKEGRQEKTDLSKLSANKDQIDAAGNDYAANENDYFDPSAPPVKQEPIRVGPKIGRNDPCPCGSGKSTNNATEKAANKISQSLQNFGGIF
ncbi:SEC-C metal-binding domain-containing protein [Niabella ginsengisoli]|uniref:SEC-C domain-containing protein n=1 Tax=Niabella ginsengisoli TaxID=522298 RepID=A0ABS9SFB0_9BACT|nr:SEC-C metal-binding domain-containing protein [Niabella ginsengisoli]MCH5597054.1 SEC-C domain-containing protein [Niabella ginsengisoli]